MDAGILSPLFALCFTAQGVEAVVPESVEELAQRRQAFRPRAVEPAGAVAALLDEPGLAQRPQMLGHGRPGHVGEVRRDRAGRELVLADQAENLAAARLGKGVDGLLHEHYVSIRLRKRKLTLMATVGF